MRRGSAFFSIIFLSMVLCLAACSKDSDSTTAAPSGSSEAVQTGPAIGTLAIAAYGPDFITLAQPAVAGVDGSTTVQAYIGINGAIAAAGTQVQNALAGPVDVSAGPYTFTGLQADESYRIVVVAQGAAGSSMRYINAVRDGLTEINADDYPGMSDNEVGHLQWAFKIAEDDLDNFHRIESLNILGIPLTGAMQLGFCSYRYAIAFTTYFLAVEQFHKLSACQEIIQPRFNRMIEKMLQPEVWQYWQNTSRGIPFVEPNLDAPYPSERDPVRVRNIMYSGHLAHMIALYEKLYGDMRWSAPGAIQFKWSANESYVYDNYSLQKLLRDHFINLPDHCIECEPNLCFPECNQHPILALKLYDEVHGTTLFDDSKQVLWDWYIRTNMINPETHATAGAYMVKQDLTLGGDQLDFGNVLSLITVPLAATGMLRIYSAAADGWTNTFMHAWQLDPGFVEGHYRYQSDPAWKYGRIDAKTGYIKQDMIADQLSGPFFAMLASEMGDTALRDRMVSYMEALYDPVREDDGTYHYPVGPVDMVINLLPTFTKFGNSVTGELIAIAEANPPEGMWRMHNTPFIGTQSTCPRLSDIDFPRTVLRRAIYDPARECLVITIDKGVLTPSGAVDLMRVDRLDPGRTWVLKIDGQEQQRYEGASAIHLEIPVDGSHDIILAAE